MAIPIAQLETWSHQGSVTQSSTTYGTIKRALEASTTKYASKSFEVFLQGSYGNQTNIWAESDVDVVIRLDSTYLYDTSALTPRELAAFNTGLLFATYTYQEFKNDVIAALKNSFGADVDTSGSKAIKIKANEARRSADVVVAAVFHRYRSFSVTNQLDFEKGICFFTPNGTRVVNYPKQHSANCTAKHQATSSKFKPMVRTFKNVRSRLVSEKFINAGDAPSYFLEGLLYNVPNGLFTGSYSDSIVSVVNWICKADRSKFHCANEQFLLLGDSSVHWSPANCDRFLNGLVELWTNWK
jgi:hypothetical protein